MTKILVAYLLLLSVQMTKEQLFMFHLPVFTVLHMSKGNGAYVQSSRIFKSRQFLNIITGYVLLVSLIAETWEGHQLHGHDCTTLTNMDFSPGALSVYFWLRYS